MSKSRFIDPQIWASEAFAALPHGARLLFIGMFTIADDTGRGRATAPYLQGAIFPGDAKATKAEVGRWCTLVARAHITVKGSEPLARFYVARGGLYYDLPGFVKHQQQRYVKKSKCPCFEGLPQYLQIGDKFPLYSNSNSNSTASTGVRNSGKVTQTGPAVMSFVCVDGEFELTKGKRQQWRDTYVGLSVDRTLAHIRQWCIDNPAKRKTVKGMPRCITNWLGRDQNKHGGRGTTPEGARHDSKPRQPNRKLTEAERKRRLANVARRRTPE